MLRIYAILNRPVKMLVRQDADEDVEVQDCVLYGLNSGVESLDVFCVLGG